MGAVFDAALSRRSYSKVSAEAPSHEELLPLVAAASRVADHSSLRPWRLIEIRGDRREELGASLAQAAERSGDDPGKAAGKPLRASLLIALVASRRESGKVPDWEQDASAAGVAHLLSLLLDEQGWGVMWRTGSYTRSEPVRAFHRLEPREELLGWLYVGRAEREAGAKRPVAPEEFLTAL